MSKVVRDLITYYGIEEYDIKDNTSFNQMTIYEIIKLPCKNHTIDQIISISIEGCVLNSEVIKTPVGTSVEGQILTGYKLLVCGNIIMNFKYETNTCPKSVNSYCYEVPLCAYVVLPSDFDVRCSTTPNIIIQDMFSKQISDDSIYNNITLMVLVEVY